MQRRRPDPATPSGNLSLVRVAPTGLGAGVLTGFFGVGGGFLIVPALVLLLGLALTLAVGTSLLVITLTSGAALAAHLASGSIDWTIASTFTGATIAGALAGRRLGACVRPERLGQLFALLLVAIAVFLVAKTHPPPAEGRRRQATEARSTIAPRRSFTSAATGASWSLRTIESIRSGSIAEIRVSPSRY